MRALQENDLTSAEKVFLNINEQQKKQTGLHAATEYQLGYINKRKIKYRKAFQHYTRATQLDPENSLYFTHAGEMALILSEYDLAKKHFQKALDIDLDKYGALHHETATSYDNLSIALSEMGQYEQSLAYTKKALAIDLKVYGPENTFIAIRHIHIGDIYLRERNNDQAIKHYEIALKILTNSKDHEGIATIRNNLSVAYAKKYDYKSAIENLEKALDSNLQRYGENHPEVIANFINLSHYLIKTNQHQKARNQLAEAQKLMKIVFGEKHAHYSNIHLSLASIEKHNENYKKAINHLKEAINIDIEWLGENHPKTTDTYIRLAKILNDIKRYDEAIEYLNKALNITQNKSSNKHEYIETIYLELAMAWYYKGNRNNAIKYHELMHSVIKSKIKEDHK